MVSADTRLRTAQHAGYRFPQGFAGFTGAVHTSAGTTATLRVDAHGAVEVNAPAGMDATDLDWTREQLRSMVGHRRPADYEQGDGRYAKQLDGDTVTLVDDPYTSSYRLHDHAISEVHRTVGASKFVISIRERVQTNDGRWLPVHFTVYYWSAASGRLLRAEHVVDAYTQVDGVYLPARRETVTASDEGLVTRSFTVTDHRVRAHD